MNDKHQKVKRRIIESLIACTICLLVIIPAIHFMLQKKVEEDSSLAIQAWDYQVKDMFYLYDLNWGVEASEFITAVPNPDSVSYEWGLIRYNSRKFLKDYTTSMEIVLNENVVVSIECIINLPEGSSYENFINDFYFTLDSENCNYEANEDKSMVRTDKTNIEIMKKNNSVVILKYIPNN